MKPEVAKTILRVDGKHCQSCVAAVSTALQRMPTVHVEGAEVGEVMLVHDPRAVSCGALVKAVEQAGYRVANGGGAGQR